MKKKLTLIKIGGNIIDDSMALQRFLEDFSKIEGLKILVHGGGKSATTWAEKMNIPQQMIEGRRVTNEATLDVATMVYAGLINKNIVADLVGHKVDAIGLTGADLNTIRSVKRPVKQHDYGFVGDVQKVDTDPIGKLLQAGFTPVFCAITHDGDGQLLNTNADTIAKEIAMALASEYEVNLYYCFEKKGVLRDVDDERSVIEELTSDAYHHLKNKNKIFSGMTPKLDNAFEAVNSGVKDVFILHAGDVFKKITGPKNHGTKITSK